MRYIRICAMCCMIIAISSLANGLDNAASVEKSEDLARITNMGPGFVVWESSRTGNWRIWKINLDGTGLMQLSPDEKDRDHFCPHISPDGKRLIYLSFPGKNSNKGDTQTPMHLISSDGKSDRILFTNARKYNGDRAVVWIDNDRFNYMNGDGITYEYSLSKNESIPLTVPRKDKLAWLVNAQKTYATIGHPAAFNAFDAKTQKVSAAAELGGCETYFSSDGVWGFWMGGAGGPINRYELATGKFTPILSHKDPRMPADRNYVYFPMLSFNRRLLAFGASPGQHDHDTSDYDIFVAPIDPSTLELTGNPVRYTFDPKCDRYPDVYVSDLELGTFKGKAPLTVKFTPKGAAQQWNWAFGDGSSATGSTQSHKYTKPGTYLVECKLGDRTLHGRVSVEPAKSPEALSASLRSDKEMLVVFSEPVNFAKAKFIINGKRKISTFTAGKDKLSAILSVNTVVKGDKLRIEGISDLAQVPNKMPVTVLDVKTYSWPSSNQGLVLLWENGKTGCVSGSGERCGVQAMGRAGLDSGYRMRTAGGNYTVTGIENQLLKACQKTNQISIEFTVKTDSLDQKGPARILTFSSGIGARNFTIGQTEGQLIFRLKTPATGENGSSPETTLCPLIAGKPVHVVVTYQPGELTCYVDGKQALKTNQVKGDFSNWNNQHLLIGDEWQGQRSWHGTLEGIGIYNRAISAAEASKNYESYTALHPAKAVTPLKVTAKLVSVSPLPTLNQIKPYREALVLNEYKVEKVLQGKCKAQKIRVAQWAILGGEELNKKNQPGSTATLVLEPFDQNPQLASTYTSDTLEPDPDVPVYVDLAM